MMTKFELQGPMTSISSYPAWTQDMVDACESTKQRVLKHDLWTGMRRANLDAVTTRNFMVANWPVIERFPSYMAMSLLKTRYGRSAGDDLARKWLVRNIRVEQNHAKYWLAWGIGSGVSRREILEGVAPAGTQSLPQWCEQVCASDSLEAGIVATNYAIEGVTGEWTKPVFESAAYAQSFDEDQRKSSLRWLELHAAYDDTHPWEALEIVCTIVGTAPRADVVQHLTECVQRSYRAMVILGDRCMPALEAIDLEDRVAA
jgi:pyrroloquinoline quinone (PQQ) biosynthesis protein C